MQIFKSPREIITLVFLVENAIDCQVDCLAFFFKLDIGITYFFSLGYGSNLTENQNWLSFLVWRGDQGTRLLEEYIRTNQISSCHS